MLSLVLLLLLQLAWWGVAFWGVVFYTAFGGKKKDKSATATEETKTAVTAASPTQLAAPGSGSSF